MYSLTLVSRFFSGTLLVLVLSLCCLAWNTGVQAANAPYQRYDPIVQQLNEMVNADAHLDKALKGMLKSAPKSNPWYGHSVGDIYQYLNHLLSEPLSPGIPQENFFLLRYSPAGLQFFNDPKIRSWFEAYFHKIGVKMKSPMSRPFVKKWLANPEMKMQDFVIPPGGYKTFADFFDRSLKPGLRPIHGKDDNRVIDSPNDGTTRLLLAQVNNAHDIRAKGDVLDIREIFNNNPLAQKFIGGPVVKLMLSELDYHHFHAPVSGKVVFSSVFSGLRTAEHSWEKSTFNHARGVYIFYNPCVGYVGMVPIGFWMVGSINLLKKAGDYVTKGDDVGQFELGSSILMFFEPGKVNVDSQQQVPIKVRQPLAHTLFSCKK